MIASKLWSASIPVLYSTKMQETCIIDLKTTKSFKETFGQIRLDDSSEKLLYKY